MAHTLSRSCATAVVALVLQLVASCGSEGNSSPDPAGRSPANRAPTSSAPPSEAPPAGLTLLVIGDSIPNNAAEDCPGCTAFADIYAQQLEQATGKAVEVQNFSDHTGLTVQRLLDELSPLKRYIAEADAIVIGIAHNSFELATDRPCGRPVTSTGLPQWEAVDADCAATAAAASRSLYDRLYNRVAALRDDNPTILRTLNRYNDWIGWPDGNLTPTEDRRTAVMMDAWNDMLCASAERHGFACADVYRAFNGVDGLRPSGHLLADDYTHPSQRGNHVIAEVLTNLGFEPLA
jgi:lysophospholipase L1-like esterase